MISSATPSSAEIIPFPKRAAVKEVGFRNRTTPSVIRMGPRPTPVVFGSGWYHDAAIEDARRDAGH